MSRTTTPAPTADTTNAFACLDQDWAIICRRDRRIGTLTRWTTQESALADLARLDDLAAPGKIIPAAHFAAVLRLTRTGDTTAARALLQMIRPGLMRIARELRSNCYPHLATEVITAAWHCIHRVQHGIVTVHTASCLLRSIRRDVLRARLTTHDTVDPHNGASDEGRGVEIGQEIRSPALVPPTAEAAEATALAGPLAKATLDSAVAHGTITQAAADIVWHTSVAQKSVPEVAAATGTPTSTAYAVRADAHTRLRDYYTAA